MKANTIQVTDFFTKKRRKTFNFTSLWFSFRLIPQGALSEHSSDSVSEIVKVSRTVSRGSTVISEEVSEVQNTVSVSKMKVSVQACALFDLGISFN